MVNFKKLFSLISLFVFFSLIVSCYRNSALSYSYNPQRFKDVFENYWMKMKSNYAYWDLDTINWGAVFNKYDPLFNNLDLNKENDIKKSVSYFRDICKNLLDNHYSINFLNPVLTDSAIFPAYDRKSKLISFHPPYPYWKIDTNYLDKGYLMAKNTDFINNGEALTVLCGTIKHKILYISFNHCSLSESYTSPNGYYIKYALQSYFAMLNNLSDTIKGLIIDVRSNLGGDLNDLNFFAKHFVNHQHLYGYAQYKIGEGIYSYSTWLPALVNPNDNYNNIAKPMIVLADNFSASTAEAFVMFFKTLPNSLLIGENTFGATGAIVEDSSMNCGSFTIPDFMSVQLSSARFKFINNKIYEDIGFPPDVFIPFNSTSIQEGRDLVLEKAISVIH